MLKRLIAIIVGVTVAAFLNALVSTGSETTRLDYQSIVRDEVLQHRSDSTSGAAETAMPAEQLDPRHLRQTAGISLPKKMARALDRRFPGWKYAEVDEEIRRFLKEECSPFTRPDIISGDFNGDDKADYAVLIEQTRSGRKRTEAAITKYYLVVFLKRRTGFKMHVLDPQGEYLILMRRGERDYDYEKDSFFTYQHDAVGTGIFGKAGFSYVYRKGKFRAMLTSD